MSGLTHPADEQRIREIVREEFGLALVDVLGFRPDGPVDAEVVGE